MHDTDWLAQRFDEHRTRLTAVAYRMLGSSSDADDAVQEAWLRLSRSDAASIENLGSWLTTVLSRVCLNTLQARRSRPEVPLGPDVVLSADRTAARMGVAHEIHGAAEVAAFSRRARGATPALLDGAAAAVWMLGGQPRVVYSFTTSGEKITAVDLIADPARLRQLDLEIRNDSSSRSASCSSRWPPSSGRSDRSRVRNLRRRVGWPPSTPRHRQGRRCRPLALTRPACPEPAPANKQQHQLHADWPTPAAGPGARSKWPKPLPGCSACSPAPEGDHRVI